VLVTSCGGRRHFQGPTARSGSLPRPVPRREQFGYVLQNLTLPALCCIELQLNGGGRTWGNDHSLDFQGQESTLHKVAAERAIRLAEKPRTFHSYSPVFREQNLEVDVGRHTRGRHVTGSPV
jgi:hypothetical protein